MKCPGAFLALKLQCSSCLMAETPLEVAAVTISSAYKTDATLCAPFWDCKRLHLSVTGAHLRDRWAKTTALWVFFPLP
ncbi:hypothetical protein XELAEV_18025345mg [Xenopus laevis]|uniref:Secreted protein n=1 Tax=Xenopus laevis TaxID=8355 RepID=A0A974D228_XENLA|nr:hypothetical protein XELAEV_18025345mg [Xenopus laevis]